MSYHFNNIDFSTVTERVDLNNIVQSIDPIVYAKTRNYLSGSVTGLSPYFTHGILKPAEVIDELVSNHGGEACAKLYSEFGWREYFQRVWQNKGSDIWNDLKHEQQSIISNQIPKAIREAETGIEVIDHAISELLETGYMHNHARMWLASMITNIGQTDWREPAKWLYYHLLDGDPASNTLSWQWIAGSFSQKKYIANQENLNRFSGSDQSGTFLDVSYEKLAELSVPEVLRERSTLSLINNYPISDTVELESENVLLYSIWNLDSTWKVDSSAERILLIEPSIYDNYPMSDKRWDFILHWAKEIPGLKIYVGELADLLGESYNGKIQYREHPLCNHWQGEELSRNWMFPEVKGYYPSFSKFWKLAQKSKPLKVSC